ncbi:MAG TPA: LemA family protein [Elusimicrobiota bacterium]|nr:LemA family protein [Elusimicrobiota bacterium]
MKKNAWLIGIIAFVGLVFLSGIHFYNRIVRLNEAVGAGWAQVENVLQRRYDLIPNLVNTVKGYAKHETNLFEEITRLRSQWGEAKTSSEKIQASQGIENVLSRLLLVVENYPTLKADQNFRALQDELAGTENRITVERKKYNEAVQSYNVAVRLFPGNIIAGMFGYAKNDGYFKAEESAQKAPQVQF